MLTCNWYVVNGENIKDINKQAKEAFEKVNGFDDTKINEALEKFDFNKLVEFDKSKKVICSNERGIYIFTIVDNPNSQHFRDDWNAHIENRGDSKITKLNSKKIVSRLVLYIGSSKELRKRLGEHYKRPDEIPGTSALKLDDCILNKYKIKCHYAITKDPKNVTIKMVESMLYEILKPMAGINR